jgi:hypothetical protein
MFRVGIQCLPRLLVAIQPAIPALRATRKFSTRPQSVRCRVRQTRQARKRTRTELERWTPPIHPPRRVRVHSPMHLQRRVVRSKGALAHSGIELPGRAISHSAFRSGQAGAPPCHLQTGASSSSTALKFHFLKKQLWANGRLFSDPRVPPRQVADLAVPQARQATPPPSSTRPAAEPWRPCLSVSGCGGV